MSLLNDTIAQIKPLDQAAMAAARARENTLTKPPGSLGRLEELAVQLAGIQGKAMPDVKNKAVITMAGDHGVVAEKVGQWPQAVTAQMVLNFLAGGAGINVLARQAGARVVVVDMGVAGDLPHNPQLLSRKVARGTQNIALGPAMTLAQATQSIETGINIVADEIGKGLDIVGTGDMGIGNTTPSAALCAAFTGHTAAEVTGRGTGIDDELWQHKIRVVAKALQVNRPDPAQPLEVLAKVGGFEIGGMVGVMLGAAANRVPVVVDGFISGAAALVAAALAPAIQPYFIQAHLSAEQGHQLMLQHLRLRPLLDMEMRLGEGTGAVLAIYLAEAACRLLGEMATFGEAGVSEKET